MRRIKTAVLISGKGSNLQALLDAATDKTYPAEIALVISNNPNVLGLERAHKAKVPSFVIPHKNYETREAFDAAMDEVLQQHHIELVCLAGFMRIVSDWFAARWAGRLINIHPSLLPAYKGLNTHARVLAAGETHHGATVHWVIPELDAGETILQESIAIESGESAEALQQRIHAIEHRLYPAALKQVAGAMLTEKPNLELVKP